MARDPKFLIYKVEELYYLCSENKGADQLSAKLICTFVFAYAISRFSLDVANKVDDPMIMTSMKMTITGVTTCMRNRQTVAIMEQNYV